MVLPARRFTQSEGREWNPNPIAEDVADALQYAFTRTLDAKVASSVDTKKSGGSMFRAWLGLVGKLVWAIFIIAATATMIAFAASVGWQLAVRLIP